MKLDGGQEGGRCSCDRSATKFCNGVCYSAAQKNSGTEWGGLNTSEFQTWPTTEHNQLPIQSGPKQESTKPVRSLFDHPRARVQPAVGPR